MLWSKWVRYDEGQMCYKIWQYDADLETLIETLLERIVQLTEIVCSLNLRSVGACKSREDWDDMMFLLSHSSISSAEREHNDVKALATHVNVEFTDDFVESCRLYVHDSVVDIYTDLKSCANPSNTPITTSITDEISLLQPVHPLYPLRVLMCAFTHTSQRLTSWCITRINTVQDNSYQHVYALSPGLVYLSQRSTLTWGSQCSVIDMTLSRDKLESSHSTSLNMCEFMMLPHIHDHHEHQDTWIVCRSGYHSKQGHINTTLTSDYDCMCSHINALTLACVFALEGFLHYTAGDVTANQQDPLSNHSACHTNEHVITDLREVSCLIGDSNVNAGIVRSYAGGGDDSNMFQIKSMHACLSDQKDDMVACMLKQITQIRRIFVMIEDLNNNSTLLPHQQQYYSVVCTLDSLLAANRRHVTNTTTRCSSSSLVSSLSPSSSSLSSVYASYSAPYWMLVCRVMVVCTSLGLYAILTEIDTYNTTADEEEDEDEDGSECDGQITMIKSLLTSVLNRTHSHITTLLSYLIHPQCFLDIHTQITSNDPHIQSTEYQSRPHMSSDVGVMSAGAEHVFPLIAHTVSILLTYARYAASLTLSLSLGVDDEHDQGYGIAYHLQQQRPVDGLYTQDWLQTQVFLWWSGAVDGQAMQPPHLLSSYDRLFTVMRGVYRLYTATQDISRQAGSDLTHRDRDCCSSLNKTPSTSSIDPVIEMVSCGSCQGDVPRTLAFSVEKHSVDHHHGRPEYDAESTGQHDLQVFDVCLTHSIIMSSMPAATTLSGPNNTRQEFSHASHDIVFSHTTTTLDSHDSTSGSSSLDPRSYPCPWLSCSSPRLTRHVFTALAQHAIDSGATSLSVFGSAMKLLSCRDSIDDIHINDIDLLIEYPDLSDLHRLASILISLFTMINPLTKLHPRLGSSVAVDGPNVDVDTQSVCLKTSGLCLDSLVPVIHIDVVFVLPSFRRDVRWLRSTRYYANIPIDQSSQHVSLPVLSCACDWVLFTTEATAALSSVMVLDVDGHTELSPVNQTRAPTNATSSTSTHMDLHASQFTPTVDPRRNIRLSTENMAVQDLLCGLLLLSMRVSHITPHTCPHTVTYQCNNIKNTVDINNPKISTTVTCNNMKDGLQPDVQECKCLYDVRLWMVVAQKLIRRLCLYGIHYPFISAILEVLYQLTRVGDYNCHTIYERTRELTQRLSSLMKQ